MNISRCFDWRQVVQTCCAAWMAVSLVAGARAQTSNAPPAPATVIEIEGTVQTARARATEWRPARTNESLAALDRVRTREESRAALRLTDRSLYRLGELSEFVVESTAGTESPASVGLLRGLLYFFHRGNPKDVQLRTRAVSAAIRGTEFQVEVADNGRTVLTLFDGEVELTNPQGTLQLVSGEQATIDPGQPPVKTPMLVPKNDLIQWCLYYPGVLDATELNLTPAEQTALQSSLAAYRSGDLLQALASVPAGYQPASDSARIYLAAVLLSVGKLDAALPLLDAIPPNAAENTDKPPAPRLAEALRRLIAVVKNSSSAPQPGTGSSQPKCASLQLAESYQYQAQADLKAALVAAREATTISPEFGFAWARVAELEFSFGRRRAAQVALSRSLELAPRNAQAVALRGFLLAAEDRIAAAFDAFNEAIALDGALGNAWLGRGLCQMRHGELDAGREDLQVAAVLEPQRALFRSYLGKAWHELGEQRRAEDELRLAKSRDPRDPTAFLYEALLLQEENRINEAITSLEHSQELNDNRRIYRSRLLLDQDQAVRGANLANIYRDAGLTDWSVREAGKAVNADYANYSAHLFLADSYAALLDPYVVNLRYETAATTERLLANLLAPVGGAPLSPTVSQLEYSRLFDREGFGLATDTEYQSRGAWSQSAVQHGWSGKTAYAAEVHHRFDPGWVSFADFRETSVGVRLKQEITGSDALYLEAFGTDRSNGDLKEESRPNFRAHDRIEPIVLGGWSRTWSPGSRTLLLAGHLNSTYTEKDPDFSQFIPGLAVDNGVVMGVEDRFTTLDYRGELAVETAELQHILSAGPHTVVAGAQGQLGEFQTRSRLIPEDSANFAEPVVSSAFTTPFERWKIYGYHTWQVLDPVWLTAGLTFDTVRHPANHRAPPISDGTRTVQRLSPKAGVVWQPASGTSLRIAHSQGLTGTSFDQNFALEPTQVAGVNQAFRSLIPESIAGANTGVRLKITGAGLEQRIGQRTYLAITAARHESPLNRDIGVFARPVGTGSIFEPATIQESVDYREDVVAISLRQFFGDHWSVGASYQLSETHRKFDHPAISPDLDLGDSGWSPRRTETSVLNRIGLDARFQHRSGFFAETRWEWWLQDNRRDLSGFSDPSFWRGDILAGWRLARRRVEVSMGVLNVGDQFEHLAALSGVTGTVRERTFVTRLSVAF